MQFEAAMVVIRPTAPECKSVGPDDPDPRLLVTYMVEKSNTEFLG